MITNHKLQASLTNARFSPKPNDLMPEQRDQTSFSSHATKQKLPTGIIEGFFGTPWPEEVRLRYPAWLKAHNFSFYIYAPKNDAHLRRLWREPYPLAYLDFLTRFHKSCHEAGITTGIGFSPLGATTSFADEIPLFKKQLTIILEASHPGILALLFDDIKIDSHSIAQRQNAFLQEAANICQSRNIKLITCPTFYTPDPILSKVFGAMPKNYYTQFLQGFSDPKSLDVFWTGPKVISPEYPLDHLIKTQELLGRKPFIWDNYPVNDGRLASSSLYLSPFAPREFLPPHTAGVALNPMKEALLSQIPLVSFHQSLIPLNKEASSTPLASTTTEALKADFNASNFFAFNQELLDLVTISYQEVLTHPLETWPDDTKEQILTKLKTIPYCQATQELIDFINGKYEFDPACLTG